MFTVRFIKVTGYAAAVAGVLPLIAGAQQITLPAEQQVGEQDDKLPPEEKHIRTGIILLAKLYKVMEGVRDETEAKIAVPVIVEIMRALREWGQMVPTLPLRSPEEMSVYENRYLPIIRKLNDHLRVQGERLAAANYYESQDLLDALLLLYSTLQQ